MSLLSYFLFQTNAPTNFKSIAKYGHKHLAHLTNSTNSTNSTDKDEQFELCHKIYFSGSKMIHQTLIYETFFSNGTTIIPNHLSTHKLNGMMTSLITYYGDVNKYDDTFDVCYVVDLINETLGSHNSDQLKTFWNEIIPAESAESAELAGPIVGYLISKDSTHNPKKIQITGQTICEMLGNDLEICYVDYLKYSNFDVLMYCKKYNMEEDLLNANSDSINQSASEIAKRKIIGHCILVSNDVDVDEKYMAQIIMSALNFDKKKYESMQKKDLLKMYAKAYVIQNSKPKPN